jgi:prepilin-type N-terminal cleavage/methylation domain-containing protein
MHCSIFSKNKNKGFTLLELIVVMSIATIIMTTLVIQQDSWNDSLVVNTQAYELALMIRQAQVYSLGVREDISAPSGTVDKFNVSYGVYMDQNHLDRYVFFVDRNGNKIYDSGPPDEAIEIKTFNRGVLIKDVCGNKGKCFPGIGPLEQASILFFRPKTEAIISLLNFGGNPVDVPPVVIRLTSPKGKISSVKVEANGQVSIQ